MALTGDNGKYLGRVTRGGTDYIEVTKPAMSVYTQFRAMEIYGKLLLLADNGKYWSRIGDHSIQAAKTTPDEYCRFTVYNQPDGTVVLQADNGLFLSRITRNGVEYLEASKHEIDQYCKLKLEFQM